jgi:cyclophilin family peptidyl-prolyl cis-trans isomerase
MKGVQCVSSLVLLPTLLLLPWSSVWMVDVAAWSPPPPLLLPPRALRNPPFQSVNRQPVGGRQDTSPLKTTQPIAVAARPPFPLHSSSLLPLRMSLREIDVDKTLSPQRPNDQPQHAVRSLTATLTSVMMTTFLFLFGLCATFGQDFSAHAASTDSAVITDRIYLSIKGIPVSSTSDSTSSSSATTAPAAPNNRIVIGLFGKEAPNSVRMLKQLVSSPTGSSVSEVDSNGRTSGGSGGGLPAPCRPKAERALQKEQLEANKVYNACMEREGEGVSLLYSTIWRIVPNERIDVGAVTGRFIAREYPTWSESSTVESEYRHDEPGIVSVRRGNQGGFGFTIYPGTGSSTTASSNLDQDHIVVGRVVEGLDVIDALNTRVPVVASSSLNYMTLTGGPKANTAPDRSCRYGGPMYCNENKPLVKLVVTDAGILKKQSR